MGIQWSISRTKWGCHGIRDMHVFFFGTGLKVGNLKMMLSSHWGRCQIPQKDDGWSMTGTKTTWRLTRWPRTCVKVQRSGETVLGRHSMWGCMTHTRNFLPTINLTIQCDNKTAFCARTTLFPKVIFVILDSVDNSSEGSVCIYIYVLTILFLSLS